MEITPQERTAITEAVAAGKVIKNGAPTVRALEKRLGDIDPDVRDLLWEAYQAEAVAPEPEPEPEPAKRAAPRGHPGPVMWIGPTIQTGVYIRNNQNFVSGAHLPRAIREFLAKRPDLACLLVPASAYLQAKADRFRPGSDLAKAWAEARKL